MQAVECVRAETTFAESMVVLSKCFRCISIYVYIYIYQGWAKHSTDTPERQCQHDTDRQILTRHKSSQHDTNTLTQLGPTRPTWATCPTRATRTHTHKTGNTAQVKMNIQIGSSQVSASQSTRRHPTMIMHNYISRYICINCIHIYTYIMKK